MCNITIQFFSHAWQLANSCQTITMVVPESEVVVIEKLPIEVLEIILNQLSLKDIGNCSQTCIWFKNIIEVIYKNKSKENCD